ncbi:two-component regulator propeller domain-containing protein [Segatella asaccharophila]|jgi:ligand-binding sensor domain-containing protein/AraC-like DNA-binding protein
MIFKNKNLFISIFLLLSLFFLRTGGMEYRFQNVTIPGASTILCLAQDGDGMIWMGTERGLYCYDGYHFYPHFEEHSFSNLRVHCILRVGDCLYLGSDNGLLIYNVKKGSYESMAARGPKDIRALLLDGKKIYLGSSQGLYSYCPLQKKFYKEWGHHSAVYSLLKTPSGLMIGTINGLFLNRRNRIEPVRIISGRQPLVNALASDRKRNCVWLGTEGALYAFRSGKLSEVKALRGNSVKSLTVDDHDVLFIGTDNGLYTYNDKGKAERIVHDSRYPQTLVNNIVWSIFKDRWNNIWLGTDNGISLFSQNKYYHWVPLSDITGNGDGNCLHVFFQDRSGMNWIGGTSGLIHFRMSSGGYSDVAWYRQNDARHTLSHNRVRKVYQDPQGDIWVATDHGINYYNPLTRSFRNFIVRDHSGTYSTTWAYDILQDRLGRLWIASYMGGVFVISKKKLLASRGTCIADRYLSTRNGLHGIHVEQLCQDRRGRIWALLFEKGIDCIDPATFHVTHARSPYAYNVIAMDSSGRLWAGRDGGVDIFTDPSGRPVENSFHDNTSSGRVTAICNVQGRMWVLSSGVCRIICQDGNNTNFRVPEMDVLAACYSPRDQRVYLAGNDGYITMSTSMMSPAVYQKSHIILSELLVNGKRYLNKGGNVRYQREFVLPHNENDITFELTDLPYNNHPSSMYAYRLEGNDKSWQYENFENGRITYNGLDYGSYRLVIKAMDGKGNLSGEVYSVKIRILPPWYLTFWAKCFYILFLLGLILWVFNFYMVKKRLKMEHQEKERILEQSRSKIEFYAHLSRHLKEYLGGMMGSINRLMSPGAKASSPLEMENIRRNTVLLGHLTHKSLDIDSDAGEEKTCSLTSVDIIELCRQFVGDSQKQAAGKKIVLKFSTNEEILFKEVDMVKWSIIFYDILEYMIGKSSRGAMITFIVGSDMMNEKVSFSLSSNGMYLLPEERMMVFQRFSPLYAVRKYTSWHQGTLKVESSETRQTVFLLTFPLDRSIAKPIENVPASSLEENADDRLLAEITEAIEKNIEDSDFNVTQLQKTVGIGNKQLYRKIKQLTDMTPVELIRNLRMKKAASLLKEGKFSVSEVMYMVGFSNSGYFSKCFQKAFGVTPKEYQ